MPSRSPGWRQLRLDAERGLLTVPSGTELDLGATAKAQTADWAAAEIAARYGCSALVELGGDLAVAGDKADWQVMVAERAGVPGQQITLHSGGLERLAGESRQQLAFPVRRQAWGALGRPPAAGQFGHPLPHVAQ
ncbi:MAG TPA: FAD:protein FMN transferase, partial [Jatrophihabitans sp.]|nr:FAD:protein FMN transferase [Jatrophihabitans sp.]